MNLQGITIIFVIIFLPIILISTFYIQKEVDSIALQMSYDTKLIDATTDAVSALEINTANEKLSAGSDSLRSIIEASNSVLTTTLATNLGMSNASKSKILPYIPAVVYTLYDGYYIYSPNQSPKVLVDKNGVYVRVGDIGVTQDGTRYKYDPNEAERAKANNVPGVQIDSSDDCGKILYCLTEDNNPNDPSRLTDPNRATIRCTTEPEEAYFTTNYILKSFIPYTMRYNGTNYNIVINYTLDNFITISGNVNNIYYSKSGYLIDIDSIEGIYDASGNSLINEIVDEGQNNISDWIDDRYKDPQQDIVIKFKNEINIRLLDDSNEFKDKEGNDTTDNVAAIKYYLNAYLFTLWVKDNFDNLNESMNDQNYNDIQAKFTIKQSGTNVKNTNHEIFYEYSNKDIFKTNGNWNVENTESNFYEHKRNVIKNSIQYNLNLAMAVYNAGQGDEYYQMPVLSDPEWDKLLSNVSVLAFMQGLPCGFKTYNNYALVTSKNNEIMTNKDDILYIPICKDSIGEPYTHGVLTSDMSEAVINAVDNDPSIQDSLKSKTKNDILNSDAYDLRTAHKIDCMEKADWLYKLSDTKYFQSFSTKDIKYDKEFDGATKVYKYDHVANTCSNCVVNPNYNPQNSVLKRAIRVFKNDYNANLRNVLGDADFEILKEKLNVSDDNDVKKSIRILVKAEYIADAKIKQTTYKSVELVENYGIQTVDVNKDLVRKNADGTYSFETYDIGNHNCYEIEVAYRVNATLKPGERFHDNVYLTLDNDKIIITTTDSEVRHQVFKKHTVWGSNPVIGVEYDINNGSIIINNLYIESITYKYK